MVKLDQIGGGTVRRRFTMGGVVMLAGANLTGDQIRAMGPRNAQSLIENRFIEVWPKAAASLAGSKRFVIGRGQGKYAVVEGREITTEPLSKEDALALAKTGTVPAAEKSEADAA